MHFLPRPDSSRRRIELRAYFLELAIALIDARFLLDNKPFAVVREQLRFANVPITLSRRPVF